MIYGNELRPLQMILTRMLSDIVKLCEENGIEYFIIGGTALGAVRHEGFIPWDDDIDIAMTRENYNRFLEIATNKMRSPYFLQYSKTDKKSPYTYAKVRLDNSVFSEYCNRNIKMHQGIYVDVFPYDNMPDDDKEYKKWFSKIQRYTKLYVYSMTQDVSQQPKTFKEKVRFISRRLIHFILTIFPKKMLLSRIIKLSTKYNTQKTKAMTCVCFPKLYCEYAKYTDLFPLKEIRFENITVAGPGNMDAYLTNHYGNYMELPPVELRFGHRPYSLELPQE